MTTFASFGWVAADTSANHHGWWGGGWMWLPGTLMMVFFAALIGFGAWAVVRSARRDDEGNPSGRARKILAERYAQGEISGDEYRERLGELH